MNDESIPIDDDRRAVKRVLYNVLLVLLGAVCVMLARMPTVYSEGVSMLGGLPVILVYSLALRNQTEVRPVSILLIGLFQDVLSGGTIGVWALLYTSLYALVLSQQEGFLQFIGRSALFSWLGFILVALLFAMFSWLVGWIVLGALIPIKGLFFQACIAMLLYPVTLLWRIRLSV
ncbi:MAG: hypothetical protein OXF05_07905 [Hyphomicrobiales bacterium]|nr:hypothetical protein [Hyphomicrobiales bacterium]MCY4032910.1 hypothetical protein [Hyphomicrobiales bacterium]MCY4038172.1 hypothetical protein [Hyphomicrobiales bacterium]